MAMKPAVLPTVGAGVGGLTGGVFSDEGATLRGILQGALLGAGAGMGGEAIRRMRFQPETVGLGVTMAGAGAGGLMGQRRVSPWAVEKMKLEELEKRREQRKLREVLGISEEKEGAFMATPDEARTALKKEAEQTKMSEVEFNDRLKAFDFGMDVFFGSEHAKMDKKATAEGHGVEETDLAPAAVVWLQKQTEEQTKE
jgi:hypothetical protein